MELKTHTFCAAEQRQCHNGKHGEEFHIDFLNREVHENFVAVVGSSNSKELGSKSESRQEAGKVFNASVACGYCACPSRKGRHSPWKERRRLEG